MIDRGWAGRILTHGRQEPVALADHFNGIWKGRGVLTELKQDGATVSGCVDRDGEPFTGSVSGNILRGRSVDPRSGVVSLFVLSTTADGALQGVRSTNGAPFRLQQAAPAPAGTTTRCSDIPAPVTGCDSILHGINFGFDSAAIRPDSAQLLQQLHDGLKTAPRAAIVIEGHTSSEGSEAYNLDLSTRRAQAVIDDLIKRGIAAGRVRAQGRGESTPIAGNDSESGRALNRRVEVHCSGA